MKVHVEPQPDAPEASDVPHNGGGPRPRKGRQRDELECTADVHILVLDDDPSVCQVIRAALNDPNYHVDTESEPSRMEARLQRKQPYHLVLLDYVLPGLEPEQVFGWVQLHQKDAGIIVITGHPSIDSALNCLRAGTFDYLTKPFQISQLQDTVTRCLERKGLLRLSEDALQTALGAVIRERRKGQGLTLAQLASRADVSLGYLSQIELGKNSASIDTLYKICLGLGTKLADLFEAVEARC